MGVCLAGAAAAFTGCLLADTRIGGRAICLMGMLALMRTLEAGAGTGGRLSSVNAGKTVAGFSGGGVIARP